MLSMQTRHLIHFSVTKGVRIVRFIRPDLREHLDEDVPTSLLYRQLHEVVTGLAEGQTLVINLAVIERFTTTFYRCLLKIREDVLARAAKLILCRVSPEHQEIFTLFRAERLFRIVATEEQALRQCGIHARSLAD
jgi:anti-anti-sigma regulatory factor